MKILQFVPYFIPYNGGQERYVYNLSRHLVKMGHEVHVITSNYPKSKEYEVIDGITIERYRCLARPLRNPITPGFLTLNGRIKDFDVIHTHNEHSSAAMAAAYLRRKNNIPLVLTCHGQLRFGNIFADAFERIYSKTIGRKILDRVDVICVNSIMDRDYFLSLDPHISDKIKVLSNAIDPEFFKKLDISKVRREIANITESHSNIILYVGRLIRRKGIEWLIKATSTLLKKFKEEFLVVLVGEGEDKPYFIKLTKKYNVEDKILFLGEISNEELVYLYKNSDIFVLPSLSEVCPTVVLEAMYFGLPVIATDIPGVRDHFKDVALLVPPRDAKKLAFSMIKLFQHKDLAERLSLQGSNFIRRKYTWNRVSQNYEKVYLDLFNKIRE